MNVWPSITDPDYLTPLAEVTTVGDLKGDEPEMSHTFVKKVGDTHVSCEDCGHKILYADNAEFGNLIREHECPAEVEGTV